MFKVNKDTRTTSWTRTNQNVWVFSQFVDVVLKKPGKIVLRDNWSLLDHSVGLISESILFLKFYGTYTASVNTAGLF